MKLLSTQTGRPITDLGAIGTLDWGDWIYALVAAFIGGGASAVTSGFVVAMKDPTHYNLSTASFYQLVLAVFLASGLINAMAFLRNKPLPSVKTTTVVTEKVERTGAPTVTTKTTSETLVRAVASEEKQDSSPKS